MEGIINGFFSVIEFLKMLIGFPLWLITNVPQMFFVMSDAIEALPDFLVPIASLSISVIFVMAVVKIL